MAEKKFEEAMERLEDIVQSLEEGELPLEKAIKVFEEGMRLLKFCSGKLEEAEKKVTLLVKQSNGRISRDPFDYDDEEDLDEND